MPSTPVEEALAVSAVRSALVGLDDLAYSLVLEGPKSLGPAGVASFLAELARSTLSEYAALIGVETETLLQEYAIHCADGEDTKIISELQEAILLVTVSADPNLTLVFTSIMKEYTLVTLVEFSAHLLTRVSSLNHIKPLEALGSALHLM